eukprot:2570085-Prymnesium_polylepis.1
MTGGETLAAQRRHVLGLRAPRRRSRSRSRSAHLRTWSRDRLRVTHTRRVPVRVPRPVGP